MATEISSYNYFQMDKNPTMSPFHKLFSLAYLRKIVFLFKNNRMNLTNEYFERELTKHFPADGAGWSPGLAYEKYWKMKFRNGNIEYSHVFWSMLVGATHFSENINCFEHSILFCVLAKLLFQHDIEIVPARYSNYSYGVVWKWSGDDKKGHPGRPYFGVIGRNTLFAKTPTVLKLREAQDAVRILDWKGWS